MGTRSKSERAEDNRLIGKSLEDIFVKRARSCGLLAIKNHLTAKMTYAGNIQVKKSDLDYRLITQEGRVGYFDCKNFAGDSFIYSMIDDAQLKRAMLYNEWKVPAGFVVLLRGLGQVVFYSGQDIALKGERSRLGIGDGKTLGRWENFDLKLLFG